MRPYVCLRVDPSCARGLAGMRLGWLSRVLNNGFLVQRLRLVRPGRRFGLLTVRRLHRLLFAPMDLRRALFTAARADQGAPDDWDGNSDLNSNPAASRGR